MELSDLTPGLLVRDGTTLLKISSVYPDRVTATILLEGRPMKAPPRTRVRTYAADYIPVYFDEATDGQIKRMDEVYTVRGPVAR